MPLWKFLEVRYQFSQSRYQIAPNYTYNYTYITILRLSKINFLKSTYMEILVKNEY